MQLCSISSHSAPRSRCQPVRRPVAKRRTTQTLREAHSKAASTSNSVYAAINHCPALPTLVRSSPPLLTVRSRAAGREHSSPLRAPRRASQLLFLPSASSTNNLIPTMLSPDNPFWNPFCHSSPYSTGTWDFTPCFQDTTLSLIPFVLLGVVGGLAFPGLATRYKKGERPEKGGKDAYAVKLVRSQ